MVKNIIKIYILKQKFKRAREKNDTNRKSENLDRIDYVVYIEAENRCKEKKM